MYHTLLEAHSTVTYICQLNCDVRVWHGKTRDFIIDGTIYWVRLFEVSLFELKGLFLLRNIRKIDGTFKSVRAIHSVRPIRDRGTEVWLYYATEILCYWYNMILRYYAIKILCYWYNMILRYYAIKILCY
jgi:hypothetical protein